VAAGSGAWSHGGGPRALRERTGLRDRLARVEPDPDVLRYRVFLNQLNDFKQNNDVKTPNDGTATHCFGDHCERRIPSDHELRFILLTPYPDCPSSPCMNPNFGPTRAIVYWSSSS
jgi:hypothetical protein